MFEKPYPFYTGLFNNLQYIIAFSVFTSLFFLIAQPFGLSTLELQNKNFKLIGLGMVAFFVLSTNFFFLPRLFPKTFKSENWDFGKEISWELWNYITCVLIGAIYWAQVLGYELCLPYFIDVSKNAFFLSIFLIPFCSMTNYISRHKAILGDAVKMRRKLESPPMEPIEDQIVFASETRGEKFTVSMKNLLYIQSYANYANIVLVENGKIEETLIRSSLNKIEQQLTTPLVTRCHRSFIVNLTKVRATDGTKRKFILKLHHYPNPIPVSRESIKRILKLLNLSAK